MALLLLSQQPALSNKDLATGSTQIREGDSSSLFIVFPLASLSHETL